jgi:CHAD domain-containing protein
MSYRLEPLRPVDQGVRRVAASQIGDLLADHGGRNAPAAEAVHEARKAIKRLRALLSLVREGLAEDDLEREKDRLRSLAGMLAGARDAQVMMETTSSLENGEMHRSCQAAARKIKTLIEEKRNEAEKHLRAKVSSLPVGEFKKALKAFEALPLNGLAFDDVLDGFARTYRRGRKMFAEILANGADDEGYHELRKQVQQHWRHLQLLSDAWPKALRPQIALAHELAETLGKDHDIAVLAAFVRHNAAWIGDVKGSEAYLRLCVKRQGKLRARANLLARRLYAETPKAICKRLRIYWETARELGEGKNSRAADAKALALS